MAGTPISIPGAREVLDINQAQRVVDMAPTISMLESDRKSLTTLLDSLGVRQVFNHKFDWQTQEKLPKAHVVDAGGILAPAGQWAADTVDLSGIAGTDVYVRDGDILRSQDTGEVMRVDGTPASMAAVDVFRDIEGAAPGAIAGGTVVTKIGNAVVENSILHSAFDPDTLNSLTTQTVDDWNYTQTFRNPVGLSRRQNEAKLYGGKDRAHERMIKLLEHLEEIEHMCWHGVRGLASSGGTDTLSGGIIDHIPVSNRMDIAGDLTEEVFNDFLRTFSRYGNSSRKTLFASRFVCDVISSFARVSQPAAVAGPNTRRNVASGTGQKLGTQVTQYVAGVGFTADIVPAHALEGLPGDLPTGFGSGSTPQGWDGHMVLLDSETVKLAKYGSTYVQLEVDVQLPGQDGLVDSYISDVGMQRGNGAHQGLGTGITG